MEEAHKSFNIRFSTVTDFESRYGTPLKPPPDNTNRRSSGRENQHLLKQEIRDNFRNMKFKFELSFLSINLLYTLCILQGEATQALYGAQYFTVTKKVPQTMALPVDTN